MSAGSPRAQISVKDADVRLRSLSGDSSSEDGFKEFVSVQLKVLKEKIVAEHQRLLAITPSSQGPTQADQSETGQEKKRRSFNVPDGIAPAQMGPNGQSNVDRLRHPRLSNTPLDPLLVAPTTVQSQRGSISDLPALSPRGSIRDGSTLVAPVTVQSQRGSISDLPALSPRGSIRELTPQPPPSQLSPLPPQSPRGSIGAMSSLPALSPRGSFGAIAPPAEEPPSLNAQGAGRTKRGSSCAFALKKGFLEEEDDDEDDENEEKEVETANGNTMSHEEIREEIQKAWHSEACASCVSETFTSTGSFIAPMPCEVDENRDKFNMDAALQQQTSLKSILSHSATGVRDSHQFRVSPVGSDTSMRMSRRHSVGANLGANAANGMNARSSTFSRRVSVKQDWARSGSVISFDETTNFEVRNQQIRGTPRGSEIDLFELLPVWQVDAKKRKNNQMSIIGRTKSDFSPGKYAGSSSMETIAGDQQGSDKVGNSPWFVLHPSSPKHIMWDLVGLFLIGFDCVTVPLEVFEPPETLFTLTMGWVIRLFWTLNIPISFCTGYVKRDGNIEMRPRKVAMNYVRTWLTMDVFVVVFDWTEAAAGSAVSDSGSISAGEIGGAVRIFRMLRVVRLFRIIKAQEITDFITEHIRSERVMLIAVIAKIMAMMLGSAHVVACIWYGLGRYADGDGEQTWVKSQEILKQPFEFRYATSLHWSLLQFSGTLLFDPTNMAERAFAVSITFTAFVIAASFVSSITTSMTRLQILASQQSTQILTLRRYLVDHNISRRLTVRVLRNAQHALEEHRRTAPESSVELLKLISEALRAELHFEIYSTTLWVHPFFSCYSTVNPTGVRKVCHTAVSVLSLASGDVLFSDLEYPAWPRMFFLISGCLSYEQQHRAVQEVSYESWMCEATLWTTWRHCGTITSLSESRIVAVDAVKFQNICTNFSTDHAMVYGIEFIAWLNLSDRANMTDLGEMDYELEQIIIRAFPFHGEDGEDEEETELDFRQTNATAVSGTDSETLAQINSIQSGEAEKAAEALKLEEAKPSQVGIGAVGSARPGGVSCMSRDSARLRKGKKRRSHGPMGQLKSVGRKVWRCCWCKSRDHKVHHHQKHLFGGAQIHPHPTRQQSK